MPEQAVNLNFHVAGIDLAIIIAYIVGILILGCWAGLRNRKGATETQHYFLASKSLTWPVIGLALFSTNISTTHLVALAQNGYTTGLVFGNFEWMAVFPLLCLALFFAPFYIKSQVATLPDFLEKRYNRSCRDFLAVVSIVSAIFIHLGFSLFSGAVVLKSLFGFNIYISIIALVIVTAIYTVLGGLAAVVMTESVQTIIMLLGAICVTVMCFYFIGGLDGLQVALEKVKEVNPAATLSVLRGSDDPSKMPWYGMMLGYPVIGLWYFCADQTIVQRVLGAKDENHARLGPIFAGFIKLLPVFILVLPGLMYLGLTVTQPTVFAPIPADRTNETYSIMIQNLLPTGLRGIVIAALLAASMGNVAGALNSTATLFCFDLFKRYNPNIGDKKLVFIGRLVTVMGMIVAILYAPQLGKFPTIFDGIATLISFLAPPITTVFVLGVFWKKGSGKAALYTLWGGFILSAIIFFLFFSPWDLLFFPDTKAWFEASFPGFNYMLMCGVLCILCSIFYIVMSLVNPHQHTEESLRLVWGNPLDALKTSSTAGVLNYKAASIFLVATIIVLYVIFR